MEARLGHSSAPGSQRAVNTYLLNDEYMKEAGISGRNSGGAGLSGPKRKSKGTGEAELKCEGVLDPLVQLLCLTCSSSCGFASFTQV